MRTGASTGERPAVGGSAQESGMAEDASVAIVGPAVTRLRRGCDRGGEPQRAGQLTGTLAVNTLSVAADVSTVANSDQGARSTKGPGNVKKRPGQRASPPRAMPSPVGSRRLAGGADHGWGRAILQRRWTSSKSWSEQIRPCSIRTWRTDGERK